MCCVVWRLRTDSFTSYVVDDAATTESYTGWIVGSVDVYKGQLVLHEAVAEAAVAEKAKVAVDAVMAVAEKEAEKITINVILEPVLEKNTSLAVTDAVQPNTRFVTATLLLHLTEAEIEVKIATVIETEIVTKIEIEIEIATRELRRPHGMLKQTMSPHRKNRGEIVAAMTVDTMAVEEAAR